MVDRDLSADDDNVGLLALKPFRLAGTVKFCCCSLKRSVISMSTLSFDNVVIAGPWLFEFRKG